MYDYGSSEERKRYYVSVGSGQVLEDAAAAPYELEIEATEQERDGLKALFTELASMDEAQMVHFSNSFVGTASLDQINRGYEDIIKQIYSLIHRLGTESTRRHIDSLNMGLDT